MKKFLLVLFVLLFAASCSKNGDSGSGYVLKIDNTKFSKEDVLAEMNSLPEIAKQFFQGEEGTAKFVDELAKKEILYLEAKKRGLDREKDFQKKLEEFKKITLINSLLEKEIALKSKIEDKDIKDYYDRNKDDFTMYEQVKLSQIVVKSEADLKKASERLRAGENFAKVASDMSADSASAKAGGNIGYFKKGDLSPELEEAVFRLKKGEVSTPIKLKDGIHIIKLTDAKGKVVEFEKVKGLISQKLSSDRQRDSFDKFMEDLKKKYKVDINKDAVSKLAVSPPPAAPEQKQPPAQK